MQSFKYEYGAQYPQPATNLSGWAGENKALAPTIFYYLKERSNNGVKIEIYDAANKMIKDFNGTGVKGLNKVYWTLNTNPPKIAKGGFIAQSSIQYSSLLVRKYPLVNIKLW